MCRDTTATTVSVNNVAFKSQFGATEVLAEYAMGTGHRQPLKWAGSERIRAPKQPTAHRRLSNMALCYREPNATRAVTPNSRGSVLVIPK